MKSYLGVGPIRKESGSCLHGGVDGWGERGSRGQTLSHAKVTILILGKIVSLALKRTTYIRYL